MRLRSSALLPVLVVLVLALSAMGVLALPSARTVAPAPSAGSSAPSAPSPPAGAAPLVATPLGPAAGPAVVPVGDSPDAILVDPTNHTVFVSSEIGNSVSEISLTTGLLVGTIPVGSGPAPGALALDPTNWTVYVANSGSSNVSVISIGEGAVASSVPVGATPVAVVVDPGNHDIYVANQGSGTVSIISAATGVPTVINTIPVGPGPDGLAVDGLNNDVFVAVTGSTNVTVISEKTNTVVKKIQVGTAPGANGAIAYDPTSKDVFVANEGSNNVSVIGGKNLTPFASIPVGSGPSGVAVDPAAKELFVANRLSDNVTVIQTNSTHVLANVPVGSEPATDGAIGIDTTHGLVYVANGGSGNVTLLSAATRHAVGTVTVGAIPDAVGIDPMTGEVFVANQGPSTVSAFIISEVTFRAVGLPAASTWSVGVGTPAVVRTNTTVRAKGLVEYFVPTGPVYYNVTAPKGYAVSKVTGPSAPGQHRLNVTTATATYVLHFGPLESLTFTEKGLPAGSDWAVSITSALHTGGPAAQSNASTTSGIGFVVVKDAWKFTVTKSPANYAIHPSHGTVGVGKHAVVKLLKFKAVVATVRFVEAGLAKGTSWSVSVTGPINETLVTTNTSISFKLVQGTYAYAVSNFTTLHPHPPSGTLTIAAPHPPYVVSVTYSTTAGPAAPDPTASMAPMPGPAAVALPVRPIG
jgi:YVTN family beta-propeller protein